MVIGEDVSKNLGRILDNEGKDPNKVEEEIDIKKSVNAGDSTEEIPESEPLEKKEEGLREEIQEVREQRKENRILSFIRGTSEKVNQETKDLSGDKSKAFEGLTENVEEALKKAARSVKDFIKDYSWSEIQAGVFVISSAAFLKIVETGITTGGDATCGEIVALLATGIVATLSGITLPDSIRSDRKERIREENKKNY